MLRPVGSYQCSAGSVAGWTQSLAPSLIHVDQRVLSVQCGICCRVGTKSNAISDSCRSKGRRVLAVVIIVCFALIITSVDLFPRTW